MVEETRTNKDNAEIDTSDISVIIYCDATVVSFIG